MLHTLHTFRRVSSLSPFLALIVLALANLLSADLRAQCGGAIDGASTPLPLNPGVIVHTEITPNSFVIETPVMCFATPGTVVGANEVGTPGDEQIVVFSSPPSPTPGAPPVIDIIRESGPTTRALTGGVLHAGGTLCTASGSEIVAITDETIAILRGDRLREYPLPPGELPVSAAAIGVCPPGGTMILYAVETTLPSVEVVFASTHDSVPLPGPSVAPMESFSAGSIAGVLHYSAFDLTVITSGEVSIVPFPGSYIFHTIDASGVTVTTTAGPVIVPLPTGAIVEPFAPCGLPFDTIGPDATPSGIGMNAVACGAVGGAVAAWPPAPVICGAIPGLAGCVRPQVSAMAPKWAQVRAYAFTTLSGVAADPAVGAFRRGKIWQPYFTPHPFAPGLPVPMAPAVAFSGNLVGDHAWAVAWARANLVGIAPPCLNVVQGVAGGLQLVHNDGHRATFSAAVRDPFRFEDFDDSEDLTIDFDLAADLFLPIDPSLHPLSETRYRFELGTTLPGLPELWNAEVIATHDGLNPQLQVLFLSDPILGLDDAAIAAALEAAFQYDNVRAGYAVSAATTVASATVDVPTGASTFEVTYNSSIDGTHFEMGYNGGPVTSVCGNGIVEAGEECDAPNEVSCSASCSHDGPPMLLLLEVPPQPGFHQLPLILESPVPVSEFSVAIAAPGNDFVGVQFQGTPTELLNPELVLQQFFPGEGMILHVLFDAIPPYDNQMLPPLPGQPIAFFDAFINDPQQIAFSDSLTHPQSPIHFETFVVAFGEELHLPGPDLFPQVIFQGGGDPQFLRGDVNQDGALDISDPISGLLFLFPPTPGGQPLPCDKAFDANDDGQLNIADVVGLLDMLFMGQPVPPPFPVCGLDPTPDGLDCQQLPPPFLCGSP